MTDARREPVSDASWQWEGFMEPPKEQPDARREPVSLKNIETLLNIADGPSRMASQAARNQIVSSYRALADRLAASEEINRIAAINLSDLEERLTLAVAEKADAQATIARLEGDCQAYATWHSDHSMHVMLLNERHDELLLAEQQVARLRAKLKELGYEDETLY